jgi:hypothetical protein
MGRFVEGADRSQLTLLPDCLEDWVTEDNAVHVVDAFVEALDLHKLGFERVIAKETGRPSYLPAVLLKLYPQYRYVLIGGLAPDHNRRLPEGQRRGDPEGLREVRCPMPANGPVAKSKRRNRRQQFQGSE